jgi:hypothetical protein
MLSEHIGKEKELIDLALRLRDKTKKPECSRNIRSLYGAVKLLEECSTYEDIVLYKEYLIGKIREELAGSYGYYICFPQEELKKEPLSWLVYIYELISRGAERGNLFLVEGILKFYEELYKFKRPECRYLDQIY